jgi:uncharacterized protein with ParB-like and HNH nuclease domain
MSFQTPITIFEALNNIEQRRYLLPAIQREFVWHSDKIEWLFDSLMRGYPISSFLFWNVEDLTRSGYKFYQFIREFRERFKIHNEEANVAGIGNFTAILDGQQRLTSLYIGLKGSYASKEYKKSWVDNEWSIPTRHLYLNITHKLEDQEDDRVYEFKFLKDSETSGADIYANTWFRVGKILDLKNISVFNKYVTEQGLSGHSIDIIARLQEVVFSDAIINFFLEKEQDLHKALNIFIRINSGGKPLDFSDLIMSIAIANWTKKDAREEIHRLVDQVQQTGFTISKDFIFKTYLYLFSSDIRFKVTNFSTENAHNFEQDWDGIRDAIQFTFELIRTFGYTDFTLRAKNSAIPIIYYLYHKGVYADVGTKKRFEEDREVIKKWLHVMSLKKIFGAGGADGTLSQMRRAFTDDILTGPKIKPEITQFPARDIDNEIKADTSVSAEFVDELLLTQKDDRYAFSILALLYPHLDYRNNDFHKDHLHPISGFNDKAVAGMSLPDEVKARFLSPQWNNSIINLQMLDSNDNMSKQNKSLSEWFEAEGKKKNRDALLGRCLIPAGASLAFADFGDFAEKRKTLLAEKLTQVLK